MLFPKADRRARGISYPLASGAAVAALHQLRQQTVPPFVASPRLKPSTQTFGPRPRWLTSFLEHLTRQIVLAGAFAAAVAVLATALPAWAALRHSDMPAAPLVVHSSAGVTGTAATRVEDLGITTFVGRIPFVQQLRFFDSVAGTRPRSSRFIEGAREASLAEYLQDVGLQMALPYLGETRAFKETFDVWATAVTEAQRAQAAEAESWAAAEAERAAALRAATSRPVWQAPSPIAGTRIPGASVTFYACVGDGFCETMANGDQVFEGAAACSPDLAFGTRFVIASDPSGRVFTCLDRGALSPTWVDVWFYDVTQGYAWQSIVGTRSDIIIVE